MKKLNVLTEEEARELLLGTSGDFLQTLKFAMKYANVEGLAEYVEKASVTNSEIVEQIYWKLKGVELSIEAADILLSSNLNRFLLLAIPKASKHALVDLYMAPSTLKCDEIESVCNRIMSGTPTVQEADYILKKVTSNKSIAVVMYAIKYASHDVILTSCSVEKDIEVIECYLEKMEEMYMQ